MNLTLENSLRNRQKVLNNVTEEIIGPSQIRENYVEFHPFGTTEFETKEELYSPHYWIVGGIKEEILQRTSPTQRYVSGMLFPLSLNDNEDISLETPLAEEALKEEDIKKRNDLFDLVDGLEGTEDEGDVDLFPQRNDYKPSTMGLTFCVNKNVPKIIVKIQGGNYTSHNVRLKNETNTFQWWLRETVSGSWDISIQDLLEDNQVSTYISMENKNGEIKAHLTIQVQARIREVNEKYIITLSVVNRSNSSKIEKKILQILFQSKMTVMTLENHNFSVYPKQYEMKNILTEDEASTELLYRKEKIYAFGHGCAADWEQNSSFIQKISTTFIPEYEMLSMTPNIFVSQEGTEVELEIRMSDLAGITSNEHPSKILEPLINAYQAWIEKKESEIENTIPQKLRDVAYNHLLLCKESLLRMENGLNLLQDEEILKAFQLANLAILLQQVNGKDNRSGVIEKGKIYFDKSFEENTYDDTKLKNVTNSWRAFQIAFILLSLESFVNEESEEREIVDLIWFPTGGGKTEAYLGVAAFQIILRRLKNPNDAGVDVLMRYTLRLLTADQFQRSSRLICSLEYLRKKNINQLGEIPFSIGIWVGSKTTPNNNKNALKNLSKLTKNDKDAQEFIVSNCSWCGAKLGFYNEKETKKKYYLGYKNTKNNLVIYCPDKDCPFHEELPIHIVDETIYQKRPTFLIGTVDKFVQLVWKTDARRLFGNDFNGNKVVSPPSLIIQDELHLISGPLGTLTGLFEILIEELCLKKIENRFIKPKIIAATATIKEFEEQSKALFGRKESRLFPSPGLESEDSFFAKPAFNIKTGEFMPGRKYVGIYTQTVRIMMSQVMTFSSIFQSVNEINTLERDPYWTLLAFYNTLRELGGGLTLIQTDIPQYSSAMDLRKGNKNSRFINNYLELTSRKQSHEISKTIDDLKVEYNGDKKNRAIDLCLASNIIEVGVDIDRLSLMAIVGQPKMTSQYIQVSGRVGRRWWERPGLIFTLYSNTKSRDKSHFEHFREYHQKLYSQVEPTSVTPFSDSSLERGLHAVIVGYLRQALNEDIARVPNWNEIKKVLNDKILPFYNRMVDRAELVDPEQVPELKKKFREILSRFEHGNYTAWKVDSEVNGYMYPAGQILPENLKIESESMINSMRNVDSECRGLIVSLYNTENKNDDWEALFQ